MVVFAGQGDARRSMALLWRTGVRDPRTGPGPKPWLSVDVIVDAAIALADAEGIGALSMRAVGERLGCTAMALYTYVPNKRELIDLMHDRAFAELGSDYPVEAGWRPALAAWARDAWEFYLRHPWMLHVSQARPVLGPNEFAMLETLTGILRQTGLEAGVLRGIIGALVNFVRGAAQTIADSRQAPAATGVPDQEWWFARAAQLEDVAPGFAERFPMVTWIQRDGASEPPDDRTPYLEHQARQGFETGLGVLLDGIEATMARVRAST